MKKILVLFSIFCATFAWLSPNHIFPWVTSHSDFLIFLSLIFLYAYTTLRFKQLALVRINLIFLIIATVPLVQFVSGKIYFFGDAFIASIYVLGFLLVLIIGNTIGLDEEKKKYAFQLLCWAILISAIISIYIELMQWLMLHRHGVLMVELRPGGRPYANFAQPCYFFNHGCICFLLLI